MKNETYHPLLPTSKTSLLSLTVCAFLLALAGCKASVPSDFDEGKTKPAILPDYTDVTIPPNIAPLTWRYTMDDVTKAVTTLTCGDETLTIGGTDVKPDIRKWRRFMAKCIGKDITVTYWYNDKGKKQKTLKWDGRRFSL